MLCRRPGRSQGPPRSRRLRLRCVGSATCTGPDARRFAGLKRQCAVVFSRIEYYTNFKPGAMIDSAMQIVPVGGVNFHLDGAHTKESIEACVAWFGDQMASAPRQAGESVPPQTPAVPSSDRCEQGIEWRPQILVFNCTGARSPEVLLGPLIARHASFTFSLAIFCTNTIATDQSNPSGRILAAVARHHDGS